MPLDHPRVFTGSRIDLARLSSEHPLAYFGFIKCKIKPAPGDILGLLPARDPDTGRLVFDLVPKIGVWHTVELHLAFQQGYELQEVYQVFHFERVQPGMFRDYVDCFLRRKQESDGWKKNGAESEDPSPEEKERVIENMVS
jgi:hypothetical protein